MLSRLFTWWNSTTPGTSFTLWRKKARLVGTDGQGNRYFEEPVPTLSDGRHRRWVIYRGIADASRVGAGWHGWLHHTFHLPPGEVPFVRHAWEKDHTPNMTGTPLAYHPDGSLETRGRRKKTYRNYEPWSPDGS